MKLSMFALAVSPLLVLVTFFIENRALLLFPTHDRGPGDLAQISGYGFPFAFRRVYGIDTSDAYYHWWIFALDVCLVAAVIVLLLRLLIRADILDLDEA